MSRPSVTVIQSPFVITIGRDGRKEIGLADANMRGTRASQQRDSPMDELIAANDPLLRTFIESEGAEARRAALEFVLTDRLGPLVRRIVFRQRRYDRLLRGEDAEDISSLVILRLLNRLQRVPFERAAAIARVDEFAATATFNAIHDFQREQFPEWVKLKRSVRHALSNDARFRTWTSSEYAACGLASWSEGAPGPLPHDWKHHDSTQTAAAIESLLRAADSPLSIADVVRALADAWQITNARADEAKHETADPVSSHAVTLESRNRLAALWRETCALPPAQRTALLLHLRDRDGSSAIALFPLMGIATLDEVAAAIAIPLRELARLWPRLPVDDLTIASLLGVPRQKVINLRAAARERLARRLRKWEPQ